MVPNFLANKKYDNENKNIELDFVSLEENYKKNFTIDDADEYIRSNKDKLKKDFIDFKYTKLTPQTLLNSEEYNDEFFKIIDDIDNKILNNESIEAIANQYNLNLEIIKEYYP